MRSEQKEAIQTSRELRDEYLKDDQTQVLGTIEGRIYFSHQGTLYAAPALTETEMLFMASAGHRGPINSQTAILANVQSVELAVRKEKIRRAITPYVATAVYFTMAVGAATIAAAIGWTAGGLFNAWRAAGIVSAP